MVVVEALSAGLSPDVAVPAVDPGAIPFEKVRFPAIVEGPPMPLPFIRIKMVRHPVSGI